MTENGSAFDHRPDPELGNALRAAFATDDDAGFARRVLAAADQLFGDASMTGPWWGVLGAWARPGLVAAMVLIAAAAFWLGAWAQRTSDGSTPAAQVAWDDPLRTGSEQLSVPLLMAGTREPDVDVVLAVALGN